MPQQLGLLRQPIKDVQNSSLFPPNFRIYELHKLHFLLIGLCLKEIFLHNQNLTEIVTSLI